MCESHVALRGSSLCFVVFFFQAEDGIRDDLVTGVQTCALPIYLAVGAVPARRSEHPDGRPARLLRHGSGGLQRGIVLLQRAEQHLVAGILLAARSEERRVGKRVGLGGRRNSKKKK